eukprot:CAMPEP_0172450000 /NCGR_PEP_ID=MMETSP1065-20121228/8540_1 /TAXON_ID=265537 /ORGANISM="Amphiprora paludosa, Strain CCMP125" /LENGTH=223 /DNA_ID=CAMNT_0013201765 /DNA_START=78 /DNA_END=749 /DNA_ORIENTATION=+
MTVQFFNDSPSLYNSSSSNNSSADNIREHDVLLGRGGQTNKHSGNKEYRTIVTQHQDEYLQARKKDKVLIARRIVQIVQERGGRFLKQNASTQQWEAVTDKRAQEKTSQALREGLDVRARLAGTKRTDTTTEQRPRKRTKTTTTTTTAPPIDANAVVSPNPSVASVDAMNHYYPIGYSYGHAPMMPALYDPQMASYHHSPLPRPASFAQRQLSKSEVTDACEV